MAIIRQIITLINKNLRIVLLRHPTATVLRAFILPIFLTAFISFARFFFVPPAFNGISDSLPIRSLADSLQVASETSRNTVVFVDGGRKNGDIDRVITNLTSQVEAAGKRAVRLEREGQISTVCKSSLRGVSQCYGAAVFNGSPNEGTQGIWNYTVRMDGGLGPLARIDTRSDKRDAQVFILPFQRAIDAAITGLNQSAASGRAALPSQVDEYVFTRLTQAERDEQIRVGYQQSITNFMGVAFIMGIIGICYHMTGFMATEREIGMSTLIESMMPTRQRWQAQAARLLSYHLAFDLIYLPGWIIGALILQLGVFVHTSTALFLFYNITASLALSSMSIAGASFFKKSQLSGVTVTILFCVLAIIAQAISYPSTAQVTVLSILFTPCNYVYFVTNTARWERRKWPTDLTRVPPDSAWDLPAIWLWIFLIIQIIVYPVIGAFIEQYLYGTATNGRNVVNGAAMGGGGGGDDDGDDAAVRLEGFTKVYAPGFIRRMFSFVSKPKDPVRAVDGLTLSAGRGQILALLGANGSGKSTTLDAIAGTNKLTSGSITIDGTGGLGIAPQKNVLWDELTVEEHIRIFNRLKSPQNRASTHEIRQLVEAVDLAEKTKARSKTLSGGQKRKLQLGMMLTGGSAVCCVDEVSSGLDPLSRRKIWDILLAERGKRTIILTTHFLDEADLLADRIAVLSKGTLRAEGSSTELKDRLGGGYRIHMLKTQTVQDGPSVDGVAKKVSFDVISYIAPSSALAAQVIRTLEANGLSDYRFSGPTIEDVFLQLAEEVRGEAEAAGVATQSATKTYGAETATPEPDKERLELLSGRRVSIARQAAVLFLKRCTVFKHNWFPSVAALLIPILAAGLCTLFIKGQAPATCSTDDKSSNARDTTSNLFDSDLASVNLLVGPQSAYSENTLGLLLLPLVGELGGNNNNNTPGNGQSSGGLEALARNVSTVTSFDGFKAQIESRRKEIIPAGIWLGDSSNAPTLAYSSIPEILNAFLGQNLMNILLTNTTLAAQYADLDTPWQDSTGDSLQLLVYICLALSAYPAFFALYPNVERRRNVRGLQYSNGVRQFPLWIAYLVFDFANVLLSSAIVIGLFVAIADVWYHAGYLFLVMVLYGLCAILTAYCISIFAANQLSAYAFTAGFNAVMFLVYLIAYLATSTYAPIDKVERSLLVVHFVVSVIAPIGSAVRALFVALNLFSTACDDQQLAPNPSGIFQYGGPILYLIVQAVLLFLLLLWLDSGTIKSTWQRFFAGRKRRTPPSGVRGGADLSDEEVANELARVTSSAEDGSRRGRRGDKSTAEEATVVEKDGLQVLHVTKTFGKNTAVDNVTFGVKHGEVFALLGPNGAGKSTSLNMIRGDLQPSPGGDVFVEGISVSKHLAAARANLGVCPQYDAIDVMTVTEHLKFYARVRGIPDVPRQVEAVLRAVGLEAFRHRQAFALSGGNKRKLSLGIALMGNPSVILLDEPSSGLDAAAKRIMWRTLAGTVPGRSILLTTHSMEEADALAVRVGILAKRMLAMGTADQLRHRFGDLLHVHLELKGAPRTSEAEAERVRNWVKTTLPGAQLEEKIYHGQMRFSVPAAEVLGEKKKMTTTTTLEGEADGIKADGAEATSQGAIGKLVVMLEENKHLGIEHYAVSPTTLDQVFLAIVGKHNIREEGYNEDGEKKKGWSRFFSRRG